jgi:hypothetical protein
MKKSLKVMVLAGVTGLLALTGCTTVAGQAHGNNPLAAANPADPVQAPPLEERLVDFPEFLSVAGTISDIEEVDIGVCLIRVFWTEVIHGTGGAIAEMPMHIYLHIDQNTVIFTDSPLEAGMFVTAVYRAPTREQQLSPNETLPAVAISDRTISVARFDENWMYGNIQLTITDDTEIVLQDGRPFDGEIDELQGRALVTVIGMSGTPVPGAENPIHVNWPSKIVVLFERDNEQQVIAPPPIPPYHGPDIASEWASAGIRRAHSLGLIPLGLFAYPTFTNYTYPTTRAEFTALAVALFESVTGIGIAGRLEFVDTDNPYAQKMGYLGVVTGVGDGRFAPDDTITREQAAVMLSRLADVLGQPLPDVAPTFADNESISYWAFAAIGHMQGSGIMSGTGNNNFSPNDDYTREQSIITVLRLFDILTADTPNHGGSSTGVPPYVTIRGEQFPTDLTELNLDNVPVDGHFVIGNALRNEDIVSLRYMTSLTVLSLRGSHISDLTPLSGLTNLTYLNLNGNQISDITPLSGLTNLEHLDLRLNMISNLTPLTDLTNLTVLSLRGSHISDLTPLSGLTNLTYLNLNGNQISDISPLSGLTNLTELRLYRNQITNWSPVAHVDYVVGRPE